MGALQLLVAALCLGEAAATSAETASAKQVSTAKVSSDVVSPSAGAARTARRIDRIVESHWREAGIQAAATAGDAEFVRRLMVDLVGRIPTASEAQAFVLDDTPTKRADLVARLIASREFAWHMAEVFDETIQGDYQGEAAFVDYLRRSFDERKPWDQLFQELLAGPWDSDEMAAGDRFLRKRLQNLDQMTSDTARVFFGVNISCAQCHDHPLAPDWTQDHYYGMQSFVSRTYEHGKRGSGVVGEKPEGAVEFVSVFGDHRKAQMMFLTGQTVGEVDLAAVLIVDDETGQVVTAERPRPLRSSDPYKPPAFSARRQLVDVALSEQTFLSRALANRMWEYFFGKGIVHPTDQMHSLNPPAIDGLLEALAGDFADSGFRIDRLAAAIVSSQTYQRASRVSSAAGNEPQAFEVAELRPLSERQLALSMVLAAGEPAFERACDESQRLAVRQTLADRARPLVESLDARTADFQSSTAEALFLSNNLEVNQLATASGENLAARLAAIDDMSQMVDTAVWTVLSRSPDEEERRQLSDFVTTWPAEHRGSACGHLVWALLTSAEFRFNH